MHCPDTFVSKDFYYHGGMETRRLTESHYRPVK